MGPDERPALDWDRPLEEWDTGTMVWFVERGHICMCSDVRWCLSCRVEDHLRGLGVAFKVPTMTLQDER